MTPKEAHSRAKELAQAGQYEKALQALIGHDHPKIAELRRQIETAAQTAKAEDKQPNKSTKPKKGIDFVGLLIALVIFIVAAVAGLYASSVLSGLFGVVFFLLLLITGVALQRRFRP